MSELENFVDYSEDKREDVLLIDTNNLSMRCLFALAYDPTDTNFNMFKSAFLGSLKKAIKQFKPNKVIFCQEGFHNWRRDLFTDYKCSRAPGREASPVDFDAFFKMNNEFLEDLSNVMQNTLFLRVDHLEADDLIALITKHMKEWNITTISTDKDFYQLHKFKNFKQWDPIKNKFIEVTDPHTALMTKIITGDKSDDIPQLKKGVGPKTVVKILNEGLDEWLAKNDLKEQFDHNRRLIDFEFIPADLAANAVNAIKSWEQGKFSGREFYNFIVKHGMGVELEKLDETIEIFSKIKPAGAKPAVEPIDPEIKAQVNATVQAHLQSMDNWFKEII